MKKITFWFIAFMLSWQLKAQITSYGFSNYLGTFTENSSSATLLPSVRVDTGISTNQPIGFNFVYNGVTYTQFKMSSNGFITLNSTGGSALTTNDLSAANAATRPIIAPLWDDLDGATPTNSQASYELSGVAPNRVLTVEWKNWEWNYSSSTAVISFQVKLYETSNEIEFVYRPESTAVVSGSASIGINSETGSGAGSYLNVTSVTNPAISSTTSVTNINTKPVSGQIYKFSPPLPCSGTPAPGNTLASVANPCYGASVTLSLQNTNMGTGLTYQWYLNGVAISGANASTYVVSSITSTNTYYCEVTCSGNTASSTALVLSPSISNAPILEPFNTFLPTCWTNMFGGDLTTGPTAATGSGWVVDGFANNGTTGAIRNEIWTTGANDWVISPVINIPTSGYELKFDAAATQFASTSVPTTAWESDDYIEVLIATGGSTAGWTALYTYNGTNQPSNTGTSNIIDLSAYAGQNIRIAFHAVEGTSNGNADIDFSIDNFQIRLSPTCPDMTGLVTSGVTAFGANTSWDDMSNGGALGYEYAVTTSATPPTSGTATTSTFYIASGLTPQTVYYLHVRSSCTGSTFGNWSTITFTTTCAPVTVFPVLEPFATFLPSCWLKGDNGTLTAGPATFGSNSWVADGFGNVGTTGAIRYNIFVASANDWIISPQYTIPASGYELRFNAAATNYGLTTAVTNWESDDFVEVLVSTTGTDNWSVLYTYNNSNVPAPTGAMNIIDLDSYAGQTVRFAYRVVEGTADGSADIDFFVDDFEIRLSPTCPDITGLIVGGVTSSTANTSWNDMSNGGALAYEYAITTSATPPTSGTSTTATFYAASGLLPQTVYYLHVRSSCTGGTFGNWSTVSFTTACAEVTSFIQNFDAVTTPAFPNCWFKVGTTGTVNTQTSSSSSLPNCLYIYGSSATSQAIVRTIPVSNLGAGTHRFKFKMRANFTVGGILELGYLTNPTDSNSFVALTSFTASSLTYVDYVYNVPAGTYSNYPAFRHTGSPANSILVDDVIWEALPSCPDMTGLVVSGVTAFGANTSWDDMSNGGALGYEYAVTTSATPPTSGTATTSTFYVASGLSPQTVYYLHVRSSCTGGAFGNWSTITFTTACAPITALPWNEGFEGLTTVGTTNFPSCWFKENGDWSSQNTNGTYSTANTGIKYIRNSWSATNEYIWTPGFDLVAGTSYDFSSFIQGDNGTGWVVDYFVNTTQNSTGATQIGSTYNVPGTGSTYSAQAYNKVTATFVPTTTGTYYFAVRVNQPSSSPWYVSFDDFALELTPACPSPNSNTITSLTPTSATITWNTTSGAYEYVIDNLAANPTTAGTAITTNTYSPSSLTPNTVYYVHVRSNCNGSLSPWYTFMFTTPLVPPANDNCSGAIVLTPGATFNTNPLTANLTGATNSNPPAPGCASFAGGDVWYSVVVPASGSITIETGGTFTGDDTGMAVYSGTCGNLVLVSCDDDSSSNGSYSLISLTNRTAGEILYINTWQYNTGVSAISYQISAYDASLSSSSFDMSSFVAYPNPVKDVLNLSYSSTITNVKVTNLLGQQVINKNVNDTNVQVNMADLAVGTYIVNISSGDLIHTIKVIKQ